MMKVNEIVQKINKITSVITSDFPELNEYIDEVEQEKSLELSPEEYNTKLQNYYDNLVMILRNHITKHQLEQKDQRTKSGHL